MKPGKLVRHKRLRSGTGLKPVNRKRKAKEFVRCYGSNARVAFVQSLPCAIAPHRCSGPIENAHAVGGGVSRKADARWIVPLCRAAHRELHRIGVRSFEARHNVSLEAAASVVEQLWHSRLARTA